MPDIDTELIKLNIKLPPKVTIPKLSDRSVQEQIKEPVDTTKENKDTASVDEVNDIETNYTETGTSGKNAAKDSEMPQIEVDKVPDNRESLQKGYDEIIEIIRKDLFESGKTLLSNIIKMSTVEILDNKAILKIPAGQKNDDFDMETYRIKQLLNKYYPGKFHDFEVVESAVSFENSDPYTFDDKISDLNERFPDLNEWIEKLGLKQ